MLVKGATGFNVMHAAENALRGLDKRNYGADFTSAIKAPFERLITLKSADRRPIIRPSPSKLERASLSCSWFRLDRIKFHKDIY